MKAVCVDSSLACFFDKSGFKVELKLLTTLLDKYKLLCRIMDWLVRTVCLSSLLVVITVAECFNVRASIRLLKPVSESLVDLAFSDLLITHTS